MQLTWSTEDEVLLRQSSCSAAKHAEPVWRARSVGVGVRAGWGACERGESAADGRPPGHEAHRGQSAAHLPGALCHPAFLVSRPHARSSAAERGVPGRAPIGVIQAPAGVGACRRRPRDRPRPRLRARPGRRRALAGAASPPPRPCPARAAPRGCSGCAGRVCSRCLTQPLAWSQVPTAFLARPVRHGRAEAVFRVIRMGSAPMRFGAATSRVSRRLGPGAHQGSPPRDECARRGSRRALGAPLSSAVVGRDETCPVSTGGGTRRVQLVREEGRDVSS